MRQSKRLKVVQGLDGDTRIVSSPISTQSSRLKSIAALYKEEPARLDGLKP